MLLKLNHLQISALCIEVVLLLKASNLVFHLYRIIRSLTLIVRDSMICTTKTYFYILTSTKVHFECALLQLVKVIHPSPPTT